MKIDQVVKTYDRDTAALYDDAFITAPWARVAMEFQVDLLRDVLKGATRWLDVGAGTGYMLRRFPDVPERTGLDASPAMLEVARRNNPGVTFVEGDFRADYPHWNGRWDVVSCMWWAYCISESMKEVRRLVANLAEWTAPDGTCFLALCNLQKLDGINVRVPYFDARVPGKSFITGVTWSWIQEDGKRHDDLVLPQVEHMVSMFRRYFRDVRIVEGPHHLIGDGFLPQDVLVATGKKPGARADRDWLGDFEEEPGAWRRWMLHCDKGSVATLVFPPGQRGALRASIEHAACKFPWEVQLTEAQSPVLAGQHRRLRFRAKADQPRGIHVGFGLARTPWDALGLYQRVELGTEWQDCSFEFTVPTDADETRLFFDVGLSEASVDLADVTLGPLEG